MSAEEAERKDALARRVVASLDGAGDPRGVSAFWVPGRIEFLGKHTDYGGGRSLVCAVERGIVIAFRRRSDSAIHMRDVIRGERTELTLGAGVEAPRGHWGNYPATVARRIARNFPSATGGADIAFASDLPIASGMSSSSALVVATFLALAATNDLAHTPEYRGSIHSEEELAAYLGTVENGMTFGALAGEAGVGTFGGSEDHAAILCGSPGALTQFSFAPLRTDRVVPLPPDHVFVIASSGVIAEKTRAALENYNRTARLAGEVLDWLRRAHGAEYPTLAAAIHDADIRGGFTDMPEPLRARAIQFARESTVIVPRSADALQRGDLASLGFLVDRSQQLAETLLGNQVPETIFLAGAAREHGAVAASAFGAGFGGSVWALVAKPHASQFTAAWHAAYASRFPERVVGASFFVAHAGPHARALEVSEHRAKRRE